jgi:hypothetical protein
MAIFEDLYNEPQRRKWMNMTTGAGRREHEIPRFAPSSAQLRPLLVAWDIKDEADAAGFFQIIEWKPANWCHGSSHIQNGADDQEPLRELLTRG